MNATPLATPMPPLPKRLKLYDVLSGCIANHDIGQHFLGSGRTLIGEHYSLDLRYCYPHNGWSRYESSWLYETNRSFQTIIFGELAPATEGTRVGAHGSWRPSPHHGHSIISSDTVCCNAYVLRRPAMSTPLMDHFWDAQMREFDGLRRAAGDINDRTYNSHYRRHTLIRSTQLELNRTYSPTNLPDYGGLQFENHNALLRQPEIYDAEGVLIAPWHLPVVMRAGTLLYAEGYFVVCVSEREPGWSKFIAQSVSILDAPLEGIDMIDIY
ncbi:hypothetical protein BJ165DRAFT_1408592 [Panaeolus papilionaceus]|nr:hypothetical protein BJ165DRAFT_1408592 [Panaeolus papilionaceus]